MRRLFLVAMVAAGAAASSGASPAGAVEVNTPEACAAAVDADPASAREAAAVWTRMGGGVPARLCEARALAAMGAHDTAARLLTSLGENPNRAMQAGLRAVILTDGARQWLEAGRADLAQAAIAQADRITVPDRDRLVLSARIAAANADWPAAEKALAGVIAATPDDALAHALLAAAYRNQDRAEAALAEAETARRLDPALPEALFEVGAALAETGDKAGAEKVWLKLIAENPESSLTALARANLQRLQ